MAPLAWRLMPAEPALVMLLPSAKDRPPLSTPIVTLAALTAWLTWSAAPLTCRLRLPLLLTLPRWRAVLPL